jgi:rfaE bifunctional protein kinase chain/domain
MNERDRLIDLVDAMRDARVALYGDLVLDRFVLGTPKRISREAPVIILRYEDQQDIPGGGANALANLAALDVDVRAVGVVGDDEPGEALLGALGARGVDTGAIVRCHGYRTPTKVRILGGGRSSLRYQIARYDMEDELPDTGQWQAALAAALTRATTDSPCVAISDYGYGSVDPEAIRRLRAPHRWVCLDSRYRLCDLDSVDAATPNQQELEAFVGRPLDDDHSVAEAASQLRERLGARFLLATRGSRGMTLVDDTGADHHIPVFGTDEVADVTGAGDTVLAVLTAALAAGAAPLEAARLANLGGGLVVMKRGTATVSRRELRAALIGATGVP